MILLPDAVSEVALDAFSGTSRVIGEDALDDAPATDVDVVNTVLDVLPEKLGIASGDISLPWAEVEVGVEVSLPAEADELSVTGVASLELLAEGVGRAWSNGEVSFPDESVDEDIPLEEEVNETSGPVVETVVVEGAAVDDTESVIEISLV